MPKEDENGFVIKVYEQNEVIIINIIMHRMM